MKIKIIILVFMGLLAALVPLFSQQRMPDLNGRLPVTENTQPVDSGAGETGNKSILLLDQAVQIALKKNRKLAAAWQEIQAMKGVRKQAGLFPDPELSVELENVGGRGIYSGTGLAETTIAFEQLLELGGKRKKRVLIADAGIQLALYRYQSLKRNIIASTTIAFFKTLAAWDRVNIASKLFRVATSFQNIVGERVRAGKVSPVEETRTSVVFSTARIRLEKAKRNFAVSRASLAAVMGSDSLLSRQVRGVLDEVILVPELKDLTGFLDENPEILKWSTELDRSRLNLSLARSASVPDLAVSAGFRKFRETDDSAYIVGVSIRLPLWNRNRGRVMEAKSRTVQVKETRAFSVIEVKKSFRTLYQELLGAVEEVHTIQDHMLPASRSAFEAVRLGYREGKFGFIEVLDSQRTYFDVEMQFVDALERYHTLKAGVEELIGRELNNQADTKEKKDELDNGGGTK